MEALEHIPGKLNQWADALSRQHMPGNEVPIPKKLEMVPRHAAPVRDDKWWRFATRPWGLAGVAAPGECVG